MDKLRIAIIGQGRSGRNIHGAFFRSEANDFCEVCAVVELDPQRREIAKNEYPDAVILEDYRDLYTMDNIELVVNSTFSNDHYRITKDLLSHGKNVVVEKPMARNRYECDDLIKCAKENNAVLAVFQQSFLAPYYKKALEICKSGILGKIKQVNITYNGFSRRWDWQTLQCRMAGSIFNTGPHPIGLALGFLDFDEQAYLAYASRDTLITSGDAEDYAKIIITAPNKATVDIEMISTDAFPEDVLKIIGSKGSFKCSFQTYKMKYIVDGENPERPVVFDALKTEDGTPIYCSEELITHEEEGGFDGTAFDVGTKSFYQMMFEKIRNNVPLEITPEMAARIVGIIDEIHAKNPLPLIYG